MNDDLKDKSNQPIEDIDEIIDDAVEIAEARKEMLNDELDDIAGGIRLPTFGFHQKPM
jgi:hypothetical protein